MALQKVDTTSKYSLCQNEFPDHFYLSQCLSFEEAFLWEMNGKRIFACSTHGTKGYHQIQYQDEDVLLFGPETRGLPKDLLASLPQNQVIRIPMLINSRSLNLSNATAVILMEALRQLDFPGAV